MGKSTRGSKERNRLQELNYENQRLKRENDQLRKRLARIDLDQYGQIKKTIRKHEKEQEKKQTNDILGKLRQEWACHEPGCDGFLEIFVYNRMNDTWYFRKCNSPGCKKRTKSKKYDPSVKGIKQPDQDKK